MTSRELSKLPLRKQKVPVKARTGRVVLAAANLLTVLLGAALWFAIDNYARSLPSTQPAGEGILDGLVEMGARVVSGLFEILLNFLPYILAWIVWVGVVGIIDVFGLFRFWRAREPWNLERGLYFAVISVGALGAIWVAYQLVRIFNH